MAESKTVALYIRSDHLEEIDAHLTAIRDAEPHGPVQGLRIYPRPISRSGFLAECALAAIRSK